MNKFSPKIEKQPSVLRETSLLSKAEKERLAKRISDEAGRPLDEHISPYEKKFFDGQHEGGVEALLNTNQVEQDFSEFVKIYNEFTKIIGVKADKRDVLTPTEIDEWKAKFRPELKRGLERIKVRDQMQLNLYTKDEDIQEDTLETQYNNLKKDLADLEAMLQDDDFVDTDEEEFIRLEINRYKKLLQDINEGRQSLAPLTAPEKEIHAEAVNEFTQRAGDTLFNEEEFLDDLVGSYNKNLITYKIFLGVDANYSQDRILTELKEMYPDIITPEFEKEIAQIIHEREEEKKTDAGDLGVGKLYLRLTKLVFKKDKAKVAKFLGGVGVLAATAPLPGYALGEWLSHESTNRDMGMAQFGAASAADFLMKVEFNTRLDLFMHQIRYGEDGMLPGLYESILDASPDLFYEQGSDLLRQYVVRVNESVAMIVKQSFSELATPILRSLALGTALALKARNPFLIIPIVISSIASYVTSEQTSKKISEKEREIAHVDADIDTSFREAAESAQTHGVANFLGHAKMKTKQILEEAKTIITGRYEKYGTLIPIFIAMSNGWIMRNEPDFAGQMGSVFPYSQELVGNIVRISKFKGSLKRLMWPIQELIGLIESFKEHGDVKFEQNDIKIIDAKRRGLYIPELDIEPGERLLVVGKKGSGKSTFLEILNQFPLNRGAAIVDRIPPSDLDKKHYRSGTLFASQFYPVQTKSFYEHYINQQDNKKKKINDKQLYQHMERLGLDLQVMVWYKIKNNAKINEEEIMNIVEDLRQEKESSTTWEQDVIDASKNITMNQDIKPSGGEKKFMGLLNISLELQTNPDKYHTIMLDEPSSGVDEMHLPKIKEMVDEWCAKHPKITMVMIEHSGGILFDEPPKGTQVIGIEDGVLKEKKSFDEASGNTDTVYGKMRAAKIKRMRNIED